MLERYKNFCDMYKTHQQKQYKSQHCVYLAGAIEHAPDFGDGWRELEEQWFRTNGFDVFNPRKHEQFIVEDLPPGMDPGDYIANLKATGRYSELRDVMRKIRKFDIERMLCTCDLVVCFWDDHVTYGAGTHGELTMFAEILDGPVYIVAGMDKKNLPGWIHGCADEVFDSFDELHEFIAESPWLAE